MTTVTGPAKGERAPLKITQEGAKRILIGLAWDSRDDHIIHYQAATIVRKPEMKKGFRYIAGNFLKRLRYTIKVFRHFIAGTAAAGEKWSRSIKPAQKNYTEGRNMVFNQFDLDLYCYVFDRTGAIQAVVSPKAHHAIDPYIKIYHSGESMTGGTGAVDDEQIHIETASLPDHYHHFFVVVKSDCKFNLDEISNPVIRLADSKTETVALKNTIDPAPAEKASAYVFCYFSRENDAWNVLNIDTYQAYEAEWEKILPGFIS